MLNAYTVPGTKPYLANRNSIIIAFPEPIKCIQFTLSWCLNFYRKENHLDPKRNLFFF